MKRKLKRRPIGYAIKIKPTAYETKKESLRARNEEQAYGHEMKREPIGQ